MQQRFFLVVMFLSFGLLQAAVRRQLTWEELLDPVTEISGPGADCTKGDVTQMRNVKPLQDITPQGLRYVQGKKNSYEAGLTFLHLAVLSKSLNKLGQLDLDAQLKQVRRVLSAYSFLSLEEQDKKWNATTLSGKTALELARECGNNDVYVELLAWRLKIAPEMLKGILFINQNEEESRREIEQEYRDVLRCIAVEKTIDEKAVRAILVAKSEQEIKELQALISKHPRGLLSVIYKARLEQLLKQKN